MKFEKGKNYILTVSEDGIEINEQPKTEDKPVEPVKLYCVKEGTPETKYLVTIAEV